MLSAIMDLSSRICSVVVLLTVTAISSKSESNVAWEIQRYDGWYNNLAYHSRGAAGESLTRLLPARYSDGVYQVRGEPRLPNARRVSNAAMRGPSGLPSSRNQTVLSLFFGYHVVFEVLEARQPGCPPEFLDIPVPEGDPVFRWNATPAPLLRFQRASWDHHTGKSPNNPRTQVNHVSSWIDGSSVYGSSSSGVDALRSFSLGRLATGSEWNLPKKSGGGNLMWSAPNPSTRETGPTGLYVLGNSWANENVFTLAEGVLWFRYHNYLATKLHVAHPDWSDEQLFQGARKKLIATLQSITLYEWLPSYLGDPLPPYPGYQKYVDPGISPEFAVAAIRFGLTLVPSGVYMRNRSCHYRAVVNDDGTTSPAMRLCNSFWNRHNPNLQTAANVDELILGMASQIAEREDNVIVEDLRDYMYGPLRFSRSDAIAMTIQRGRDFGLPSYTRVREALNLPPLNTWADLNPELNRSNPQLFTELSELYGNDLSSLELFPGGLLEAVGGPGPVFSTLISDQFQRIRNGDRFWFENRQNGLFTEEEILSIRNTTFHDVIVAVTNAEPEDIQNDVFFWRNGDPCPQPEQLKASGLPPCTPPFSMDYFDSGSKAGFGILVIVLFLFPVVSFLVAIGVAFFRKYRFKKFQKMSNSSKKDNKPFTGITAEEWQGLDEASQSVCLELDEQLRLQVCVPAGGLLRSLNLGGQSPLTLLLSSDRQQRTLLLKVPKEYDLVLLFEDEERRAAFLGLLHSSLGEQEQHISMRSMSEKDLLREAVTRAQRAQIVEVFFRQAFAKVLDIDKRDAGDLRGLSSSRTREALQCELSGSEFAAALGLKPSSLFVQSMFTLADKDGNGYLSMQEFLDVIAIFMKGSPEEKSRLLFAMHDIDGDGFMSREEFSTLLRSFMEISSSCLSKSQGQEVIEAMLKAAGFDAKEQITWEDFHLLLKDHENELQFAQLNIKGMEMEGKNRINQQHRVSFITRQKNRPSAEENKDFLNGSTGSDGAELRRRHGKSALDVNRRMGLSSAKLYVKPQRERYTRNPVHQKVQQFKRFVENYRRHIVTFCIIYGISAGVALERCYYYGVQAISSGVPETSAVGIVVSRGSAAAISFLFPYMLLTVSRNLITKCRETFLNRYIPFDAAIDFHRLMAMTAIILTVVHSLGHVVNLYVLSISELSILACLFPQVLSNNGSEKPMAWTFWFFQTVPGMTGILLLLVLSFIYVFASRYFRRVSFRGFWVTHYLYVFVYLLTVIHGSFGLLQQPRFYIYLIPPALLFLFDKLISLNRKKVEIPVVKVELLPSGVTYLEFKRPQGFVYRSGQWVRVACLDLGTDEYHPFTLTSAPHEETLSLHIRAVGPWTSQLRESYSPQRRQEAGGYPKLYLDGPFGEGHQEWTDFEVSVLVGGGIGVTPFASILKDLIFKSSVKFKVQCKKVYFIWVTRTQKQFEWVSDIIREVEEADVQDLVSVHIYITQLAEKFDLRTTMLYVCERHFQKVWNRSVFTGLRSITHFGRPPFLSFFSSLQEVHPEVGKIGVFSCGPPGLTKNVEKACQQINKRDQAHFIHHYENF
ncbi:dual oxidase 1 isoform X1 [Alosa sapidissima]|uniref:dual oxidase 1 isoform X1 n=1 Tax=Alosa sapidissima TaxID=34773 RepID=UPI001C08F6B1|nr:dual oxidase 1 isoform X1 [Alosa sapidissima]XP_041964957.1 dual oxidase 1 isoform X1 [Alosa sapidissima]